MKFYLSERCFKIKQEDDYSDLKEIVTGLPQVIVLVRWVTEILEITEFNFLKREEFKKRSTKNQVEITQKKKIEYLRNPCIFKKDFGEITEEILFVYCRTLSVVRFVGY